MAEQTGQTTAATINPFPEAPDVYLDSFIGDPNPTAPKLLFSLRLPAKHQAQDLSIVRMQDSDLAKLLQSAKIDYRDKTKFTVPTTNGPCTVKLHFLIFPNLQNEIQVDYMFTAVPDQQGNFSASKQLDTEIGQRIHASTVLRHEVGNFASIIHDLMCNFADRTYFDSLAAGETPDYLITTPPHP